MEFLFINIKCSLLLFASLIFETAFGFGYKNDAANSFEIAGQDIFFEIVEPENLRYTYRTRPAKNFGSQFIGDFNAKNIKLVPVEPANGCSWPDNADDIYGNIAFMERGECTFLSKTLRAEEVGAKGVIIFDNIPSDEFFTEMIDDQSGKTVHIPATFLLGKNGLIIWNTLKKLNMDYAVINIPVNVSYVPINKWKQPPWLTW
ncbi:hypothetical protein O3M35_006756 [Rhynocoris fuscipes]|uniref:PA domain-containing protein n=1 Tax=Rhynocoris fuscipes TaxID=488301 RepID=A0AAW1DIC3_9HEMI